MSHALLLTAWIAPLAALLPALHVNGRWWMTLAALPALALALLAPAGTALELPWLLLGVHLGLDATGRLFLLFSSLLWLSAGLYAALTLARQADARRFRVFFLLAMAGNLLLILAADALTFYLGFALMGISAYGLVVQRRSQHARRAGRIYLGWTLVGEVALFSALVLLAAGDDSLRFADLAGRELPAPVVPLLLLGFGIKLALPGLHVWLPLTYAAAPAVAAAVLSGPMIKAGLLGWLRFLPPDAPGLAVWGGILLAVGLVGIILGIAAGLAQRDPRAVLGYSSIAKTGLITAVFGSALLRPEAAPAVAAALVLFAMHHLLVKGALFLGMGEWERAGSRPWVLAVLGLLALALAGAPLTGGAAVKSALGATLGDGGVNPGLIFALSGVGTVLLMTRFLWLLTRTPARAGAAVDRAAASWLILALPASWLPQVFTGLPPSLAGLTPLAAGLVLAGPAWVLSRGRRRPRALIPPGDILQLLPRRVPQRLWRRECKGAGERRLWPRRRSRAGQGATPSLAVGGSLWLAVLVGLLAVLLFSGQSSARCLGPASGLPVASGGAS
ncbi:MAG: proton-conducting transporter membrane subunit [Gammaproteobacteria bacterium]